jgi:Peptidase A4 family
MLRRWGILLAMLTLTAGVTLTASSASAATMGSRPGGPSHLVGVGSHLRSGIRYPARSTNWSGYAATKGTYTSVSASWIQPAGTCGRRDQYAAFWVGLDGYSSRSVEQTGSEVDCVDQMARYFAWYELYPNASVKYFNTVLADDHFNASVTYRGNGEFALFIADTTQGWSQTVTVSLAGAPRSSAEVIVEAPCCAHRGGMLPLTNFGTVNITNSMANGDALGNAGGVTQLVMTDKAGRDQDTISSLMNGENFSATWLRGY